jgi:hypothetical protein
LLLSFKKAGLATGVGQASAGSGSSQGFSAERFFFEKKNQKTFARCRGLLRDSRAKVFASFFKKKRLLSY